MSHTGFDIITFISRLVYCGGIPVIIVERFDRIRDRGGVSAEFIRKDMCQALATREKYQQHGGPGIYDIIELLRFCDRPDVDLDRFMRAQALNFIIAGTDAHARNYSVNFAPGGAFRFLRCTAL